MYFIIVFDHCEGRMVWTWHGWMKRAELAWKFPSRGAAEIFLQTRDDKVQIHCKVEEVQV